MLDLDQYSCLGGALRDALDRFANQTCLIESDRDRERTRLTYSDFKHTATPLARALQDADFNPGDRTAIIMTNQSKWLISAYAVFQIGGVLVPLDYKLSPEEHLQLLAHSKAKFLIVEYHLWRAIAQSGEFKNHKLKIVLVTEASPSAQLNGGYRWEEFRRKGDPNFVPRAREDAACIVYSSGTGGRPNACVVHLRTLRPEFVRDAFVRYRITYVSLVPLVLKNLERGIKSNFDSLSGIKRVVLQRLIALNQLLTRNQANVPLSRKLLAQVHKAFGGE